MKITIKIILCVLWLLQFPPSHSRNVKKAVSWKNCIDHISILSHLWGVAVLEIFFFSSFWMRWNSVMLQREKPKYQYVTPVTRQSHFQNRHETMQTYNGILLWYLEAFLYRLWCDWPAAAMQTWRAGGDYVRASLLWLIRSALSLSHTRSLSPSLALAEAYWYSTGLSHDGISQQHLPKKQNVNLSADCILC